MGVVKIHVFDEARCLRQDFTCENGALLSSMHKRDLALMRSNKLEKAAADPLTFSSYLKRVSPSQDAEISVQCDVAVFSWLLQYAKAAAAGQQLPALSVANCMPVLISSDFLQMEELKSSALSFIAQNFAAVANLSHDLAGLADSLLSRLAKGVSEDGLEGLWQSHQPRAVEGSRDEGNTNQPLPSSPALQPFRSHLLVQRLYKHKVDHMIREPATALSRCTQCGEIFAVPYRHKLKCEAAVGSEGDPLAAAFRRHILDRGWKVQRTAQRGPSQQRPLPQSGCAYQPHTPLTPPEAPIYTLSSDSALSDSVQKTQTVGLVHTLMKQRSLIVRLLADGADALRPLLGSAADPLHPHNLTLLAGLKPSNPKLQKAVWQDLVREDDAKQMDALIAKLDSMRSQKPPDVRTSKPVKKDQA
ncbi:MAG: hypothetical protein FRX49_06731, partial [Trebouxia sp. A1-2]